ncbi:MAG: hypothetical protein H6667_21160 [Ardenticatenaceae bacterium]|nr:hypothetical protein [Ardenticatenaceae bacterium]MCB9445056.1 hypothetical protein [Ardenticatenaceae bacterium]
MNKQETAVITGKPMQLERTLGRIVFLLIILVAVINVPFNRSGQNLARVMPDSSALVIRDGLLLKGSGPEVYVLENNRRRWISTLDAFHWYGYQWRQVHEVEDEFLQQFEEGKPIHLLLKCPASPHIYALEDGTKRWIKDLLTFQAQGYVWEDVQIISCDQLTAVPDGLPIPENAGTPPS